MFVATGGASCTGALHLKGDDIEIYLGLLSVKILLTSEQSK